MEIVWFILVGLIAGWLAGTLVRGGGFGLVGDLAVGVVGAVIGGDLFRLLGIAVGSGLVWRSAVATVGAAVLIVILRVIRRA